MKAKNENAAKMFKRVVTHLESNLPLLEKVKAVKDDYLTVKAKIVELDNHAAETKMDSKGVTKNKNDQRVAVVEELVDVTGYLYRIAAANKDTLMKNDFDIIVTSLKTSREEDFNATAIALYTKIADKLPMLADNDFKEDDLALLKDKIDGYSAIASMPRAIIKKRSGKIAHYDDAVLSINSFLTDNLDKSIKRLKKYDESFVKQYENMRRTQEVGTSTELVTIKTIDVADGKVLNNVPVEVEGTKISARTNAKGVAVLRLPKSKVHSIKISGAGYATVQLEKAANKTSKKTLFEVGLQAIKELPAPKVEV